MQLVRLPIALAAVAVVVFAVGCAAPAPQEGQQASARRVQDDAPTGSHLPRKDKDRNSGIKQVSPEELERAQEYRVRSETSR